MWYLWNVGFKCVYVEVEFRRMIFVVEVKGFEKGLVDSIYFCEGIKEYEDFEWCNGFDKLINFVNGLFMK